MSEPTVGRRDLLAAVGTAGAAALAGCSSGAGASGNDEVSTPYGGWLAEANAFSGDVADRTGTDEVPVKVGDGERGLAYEPAAIRVSPGTTVLWEWTGSGSRHNVVAESGAFRSEYYATDKGRFTHTFDEPGVTRYYCTPHRNLGMKGVVEVVEG